MASIEKLFRDLGFAAEKAQGNYVLPAGEGIGIGS